MINALCQLYAATVAVAWSWLGWNVLSFDCVVAYGKTAVRIERGCLSLRAVVLVCTVGLVLCVWQKRAWPLVASVFVGVAVSWFRVFLLVGLALSGSRCFHRLHSVGAYPVFLVSAVYLLLVVYYAQRFQGKGLLQ